MIEFTHTDTQASATAVHVFVRVDTNLGASDLILRPGAYDEACAFARESGSVGEDWYLAEVIAPNHPSQPVEYVFARR